MKFRLNYLILLIALSIFTSCQENGSKKSDENREIVKWEHHSSLYRQLPFAEVGSQVSTLIMDIDKDGTNDFVIAGWGKPSMVWFKYNGRNWDKYLIDAGTEFIEAGGDFADIDGDGDLDIVQGGDWRTLKEVWWWENPYPDLDPDTPWNRYLVKNSDEGGKAHHDQIFGDFDGDGQEELAFWNTMVCKLFIAEIPEDPKNAPVWEMHLIHQFDDSQETKYEGEKLALSYYHEKGLPVTVVRPVGIYGPGDTRMLKMYKSVQDRKMIMFGGGDVMYHLTFVEDIVEGFRLAGESEKSAGETYIIAGDGWTTLMGFAEMVADELGVKPPRLKPPVWPLMTVAYLCEWICVPLRIQPPIFPRRAHIFTHDRAFDISKAKRHLGFQPKVSDKEGIHRTAQWYIQEGLLKPKA